MENTEETRRYIHTIQYAADGKGAPEFESDMIALKEFAKERGWTVLECETTLARERDAVEVVNWGGDHYRNMKAEGLLGETAAAGATGGSL